MNIPPAKDPAVPAVIHVRLVEATSSDPSTWTGTVSPADDASGWYTTVSRTVVADGEDRELFVAFPSEDDQTVGADYTLKAYFSKSLAEGKTEPELLDEFTVLIASQQPASPDGAVVQDPALMRISWNETSEYHALTFDMPNLYNGNPGFRHWIEVRHDRGGIKFSATRLVLAAVDDPAEVFVVRPPASDGDGRPHVVLLPDIKVPQPADREVPIRIETGQDVMEVEIVLELGTGSVASESVETIGMQKFWNFRWSGVTAGQHRFRADARRVLAGPVLASATREVTVEIGPAVPVFQDDDMDDLPDWWELANGLDPEDPGIVIMRNGPDGDPDGDGLRNLDEFLVGLNPCLRDAHLFPQLTVSRNPDGSVNMSFPSIADRVYRIHWSNNLRTWMRMGGDINTSGDAPAVLTGQDAGPPATDAHPSTVDERFYYLEIDRP
jgi:hypothetical protein